MAIVRASFFLMALLFASTAPADAAVRACKAPVKGATAVAADEQLARKGALADWMGKVSRFGVAYTAWRLADGKSLTCTRKADGTFACTAEAAPCRIEQVAPSQPRRAPQSAQTAATGGVVPH